MMQGAIGGIAARFWCDDIVAHALLPSCQVPQWVPDRLAKAKFRVNKPWYATVILHISLKANQTCTEIAAASILIARLRLDIVL